MADVTVCIPSIPPRAHLLQRAINSVANQTVPVEGVAVALDLEHEGAWTTRNRALAMANTEWIAFLDDDDEFRPNHIQLLLAAAEDYRADCVWGWFEVVGGGDPFPHYRGRQYDPAQPHIVPITYMCRRELLMDGPGFQADGIGSWDLQDQPVLDYIHANGVMRAIPDTTWLWHHHGYGQPGSIGNTSGLPTRW